MIGWQSNARLELEKKGGRKVVTSENYLVSGSAGEAGENTGMKMATCNNRL